MSFIERYQNGIKIKIIVKPGSSSKKFIQEINDDYILININSQPQDGKANKELIKRLSKLLKISSGKISIISGAKSKEKVLYIEISPDEFVRKLNKKDA